MTLVVAALLARRVGRGARRRTLLLEQPWLLVFGGVFLAEELYETGVVILVLRAAGGAPEKEPVRATGGATTPSRSRPLRR